MKMRISFTYLIIVLLAAGSSYSCVKDSSNLDECLRGLRVIPRWISSEPREGNERVGLVVSAGNDEIIRTTSPFEGVDVELQPGRYAFTEWETAENITVEETTITVARAATDASRAIIDYTILEPEEFTGGTITDLISSGSVNQKVYVPMYQQTRQLEIRIGFIGDGVPLLQGVEGALDGVTVSRDISYGFAPEDGRIKPPSVANGQMAYEFSPMTQANWYSGIKRLIGLDGYSQQDLQLLVSFTGDHTNEFDEDVTALLTGFHTENIGEPWVINLIIRVGVTFDMVIVDWFTGADSWIIAE